MAYSNNLIHCVWATKRRISYITSANRSHIIEHIREYSSKNGIFIDFINGHNDHIHCLVSLGPTQNLSAVIKQIKGESSRWISSNIRNCANFSWGKGYYAVSVSPRALDRVRNYIRDQDLHHKKRTWNHEQQDFIRSIDAYWQEIRLAQFAGEARP